MRSDKAIQPTAPLRSNFSVFATTPCRGDLRPALGIKVMPVISVSVEPLHGVLIDVLAIASPSASLMATVLG